MKFSSIAGAILLLTLALPVTATAQLTINPQIGISGSRLTSDPEGGEATARFGYQFGLNLRFGDRLFLQPGAFYQRSGTELRAADDVSLEEIKDQVDLSALFFTLGVGYKLIDTAPFTLRAQGGLGGTAILDVPANEFSLDLDNVNGFLWGVPFGVGIDLLNFISADLTYELGLTNLFSEFPGLNIDAKNNVVRFNVGIVL